MWCAALQVEVPTISDPLSGDLLYKKTIPYLNYQVMDRIKLLEKILHLTLEILFRLTGEDYTVVKKTSSERCQDPVSEGLGRALNPIRRPPPYPKIHEDINDQKILEPAYKMIELLTGEVPIRCQDVTIYFSMEEWDYLEGHKDVYKDVMMEIPQPFTSPVLSSKRTTSVKCPRPLLPQECEQENPNIPQDHQGEDLTHVNTKETYVRGDEWGKEEIPTDNRPDDCTRRSDGRLASSIFKSDDLDINKDITCIYATSPDISSSFKNKDLSSDSFKQVTSSDSLQTIKKNKSHKNDVENESAQTENKQFSSLEYEKSFPLQMSFVTHPKFDIEEKRFSSSECRKHIIQKFEDVSQKRVHAGEKPFSCSDCGKSYASKTNLVTHQRIHTGEKPYACPECGRRFADNSNFFRHRRTHTGEMPYSCSKCGKCFTNKRSLTRHEMAHKGKSQSHPY
ncbi:oocyte zinc finger protein XlCOF7.2-like [Ranitomeya imitator]|uniref:oocyte zinc finger protein XlCOF7.2-like n=1 Tax=Ranitomeya imitator TaxID=111125 RepID=UPI0037E83E59